MTVSTFGMYRAPETKQEKLTVTEPRTTLASAPSDTIPLAIAPSNTIPLAFDPSRDNGPNPRDCQAVPASGRALSAAIGGRTGPEISATRPPIDGQTRSQRLDRPLDLAVERAVELRAELPVEDAFDGPAEGDLPALEDVTPELSRYLAAPAEAAVERSVDLPLVSLRETGSR